MDQTGTQIDHNMTVTTFQFTIRNFSKLKGFVLSPPTYVQNLSWNIMVGTRIRNRITSLDLFLQCNGESENSSWSCYADVELRLLSVRPGVENFTKKTRHLFCSKESRWGYVSFMYWNEVTDPEKAKSYIKDDTITVEVQVLVKGGQDSKKHTETKENETNLYMTIQVLLEDQFDGHQGNDLYDPENVHFHVFKIKKQATIAEMKTMLADAFKYSPEQIRPWPFQQRSNETMRPVVLDDDDDFYKSVIDVSEDINPWNIFLEVLPLDSGQTSLSTFDKKYDVLFFFKMYDPKQKKIHYCGHAYVSTTGIFSDILPMLNQRAGFAPGTNLLLYEEIRPNVIEKINYYDELIIDIRNELLDGDIIIFEKDEGDVNSDLPTCIDYFKDLFYRVEVTFVDKMTPNDQGFIMKLSQRMTYDQFARAVAQRLGTDQYLLLFFQCQEDNDSPGPHLRCTFEGTLKDLLVSSEPKVPKKIYYLQLSKLVNESENKKQFKCIYVPASMKEEKELILYPNENGTVDDLLKEATKQIEFGEDSSGKLRFTEVNYNKLSMGPKGETPIKSLATTNATYRIEEVPKDEMSLANDEMLVSCAHFHKELFSTFGMPFFMKIKEGERFTIVKERIQKKLFVSEKEWEKFTFTIVTMGRPQVLSDEYVVNLSDFGKDHQNLQLILD